MRGRPGNIMKLPDGRLAVRYNKQDLLKDHNKVVLHLLNDDFSLQLKDGKEVTVIKTVEDYNSMLPQCEAVGMID
jgi:hypothetical protein